MMKDQQGNATTTPMKKSSATAPKRLGSMAPRVVCYICSSA